MIYFWVMSRERERKKYVELSVESVFESFNAHSRSFIKATWLVFLSEVPHWPILYEGEQHIFCQDNADAYVRRCYIGFNKSQNMTQLIWYNGMQ